MGLACILARWPTQGRTLEKRRITGRRRRIVLAVANDTVATVAGLRAQLRALGAASHNTDVGQTSLRLHARFESKSSGSIPVSWRAEPQTIGRKVHLQLVDR